MTRALTRATVKLQSLGQSSLRYSAEMYTFRFHRALTQAHDYVLFGEPILGHGHFLLSGVRDVLDRVPMPRLLQRSLDHEGDEEPDSADWQQLG